MFVLLALSQLIWALPKPASLSPRADWYDDGWYTAEVMPEQKPKGTTPEQTPEETTPKQNSDGVNPLYSPERCPNGMLPKMAQVYQGCTTQVGRSFCLCDQNFWFTLPI